LFLVPRKYNRAKLAVSWGGHKSPSQDYIGALYTLQVQSGSVKEFCDNLVLGMQCYVIARIL
jgi:hypothetical protein